MKHIDKERNLPRIKWCENCQKYQHFRPLRGKKFCMVCGKWLDE